MNQLKEGIDKAQKIHELLKDSEIPKEAQAIAQMGAIFGASNDSIIKSMVSISDGITSKNAESKTPKATKPKNYTKTQSILHDMLTENTGIAMMDSGGDYGRAWQRNRGIADFRNLNPIILEEPWNKGDLPGISKSLFHFLEDTLEYSADMTAKFKRFCNKKENKDESYYYCMEPFAESLHEGSYPEKPISDNSYNHETTLSGTIQYTIFSHDEIDYILLQIHGGADVRGGYTDPKVFELCNGWDSFIIGMTDISAHCECLDPYSDDAGYHWYETNNDNNSDFPSIWHWSARLKGVYCQDCKQRVNFS